MEHLSFEMICRIADEAVHNGENNNALSHLEQCPQCQREVEFQQSLLKISRQVFSINPSTDFTKGVIEAIIPPQRKRWYERFLHNIGNIIALVSVLVFLGYIYSITGNSDLGIYTTSDREMITDFVKIIADGSHQFIDYLVSSYSIQDIGTHRMHIAIFVLLAIISLTLIDQVLRRFFNRLKF